MSFVTGIHLHMVNSSLSVFNSTNMADVLNYVMEATLGTLNKGFEIFFDENNLRFYCAFHLRSGDYLRSDNLAN
jgi:hypothetical protein